MISKRDLKMYEFGSIEEYFDYITESQINGNHSQVKELFKALSNDQKKQFCNYFNITTWNNFDMAGCY